MSCVSLNHRVRRVGNVRRSTCGPVDVLFHDIEERLVELLESCTKAKICVAWVREARLIRAMPRDTQLIVTNDTRLPAYSRLRKSNVRKIGTRRGRFRALMHNKFVVGYTDGSDEPAFVATGSYNWTQHSRINLETVTVIHDPVVAKHFEQHFGAIWEIGR